MYVTLSNKYSANSGSFLSTCVLIGFICIAFPFGAGQTFTHDPHPVQSKVETCILYCNPSSPFPIAFIVFIPSGAAANSFSSIKNGLITA